MNMFDDGSDKDQELKDKLLEGLVEHMEQILAGGMKGRAGLGVEVQADDPDSLKAGLEQAKGAVDDHADELSSGDDQKLAHGGVVLPRTDLVPGSDHAGHKASSHEVLPRTDIAPGSEHASHKASSHEVLPRHPDQRVENHAQVRPSSHEVLPRFAEGGLVGTEPAGDEESDLMRLKELVEHEEEEEKKHKK